MGALLDGIRRRLLGTPRPTAAAPPPPAEDEAPAAAAEPPAELSPAAPASCALPSPTPRRAPIAGLPGLEQQLSALERRWARLPPQPVATKAGVRAQLAAWTSQGSAASTAPVAVKSEPTIKAAAKPKRAGRAARPPWVGAGPPALPEQPAGAPWPARASTLQGEPHAAINSAPSSADAATKPSPGSKLAALKQRQARRSSEGGSPGLPGGGLGQVGGQTLPARQPWRSTSTSGGVDDACWISGSEAAELCGEGDAFLAQRLTPRVLAAAAQRAQPGSRRTTDASGASSRHRLSVHSSSSRRTSSAAELGLTLAPWASPTPALAAGGGEGTCTPPAVWAACSSSQEPPLEGYAQRQWLGRMSHSPPAAAQVEQGHSAPPLPAQPPGTLPPWPATLMQRLSRSEMPSDLLSLRDSAGLARRQSLAGRPPLPPKRRAQSVQETRGSEAGSPAEPAMPSCASESLGAAGSAEPGKGAKRLAVLHATRRQRSAGWLSDFSSAAPCWRASQVGVLVGTPYSVPCTQWLPCLAQASPS